jgi:hypothetical protein
MYSGSVEAVSARDDDQFNRVSEHRHNTSSDAA